MKQPTDHNTVSEKIMWHYFLHIYIHTHIFSTKKLQIQYLRL